MAERKKAKKTETSAAKPEPAFVGATLRAVRLEKKMKIDDISHAINIRPSQIKAIEENDIESLPGMTYAVGFVRAYANFLGLNGADIVHRFKAEQGHEQPQADLKFPEPITESRVPSPVMVGIGAFLAVVVLVGWTIYSNMHNADKTATQVPPAPVVASMTSAPVAPPAPIAPTALTAAPVVTGVNTQAATSVATVPAAPPPPAKPATAAPVTAAAEDNAAVPAVQATQAETVPVKTVLTNPAPVKKAAVRKKKQAPVIRIRAPRSRVTLRATEASWVQVSTLQGQVIYRKVLRQGEQYDVPDQPGLVLDTANAGGLEVFVDGKRVQSLGKEGAILSGVDLTPASLKIKREAIRG